MTNSTLEYFRSLTDAMHSEPQTWQWIGPHMSQRMFGITQRRAEDYAKTFGGDAQRMSATVEG